MTKTSNAKTDFVLPIAVLTIICLVCSALLGSINGVTAPIIKATEDRIAAEARSEVLPDADGFTQLDWESVKPDGSFVTEAYKADNGAGYVFMITGNGYGGKNTMKLIVGMDADGTVVRTKTLQHSETAGMGSKTADDAYRDQWIGVTADTTDTVDAVSGATFSSNYYMESMRSAFEAYALVSK